MVDGKEREKSMHSSLDIGILFSIYRDISGPWDIDPPRDFSAVVLTEESLSIIGIVYSWYLKLRQCKPFRRQNHDTGLGLPTLTDLRVRKLQ